MNRPSGMSIRSRQADKMNDINSPPFRKPYKIYNFIRFSPILPDCQKDEKMSE